MRGHVVLDEVAVLHKLKEILRVCGLFLIVLSGLILWSLLSWWAALVLAGILVAWLALARSGRRSASVARMALSSLPQRLGSSSVVVIGIAGVVAVLVALLSMAQGYEEVLHDTGSDETAIVMRGGSTAEAMSVLSHASVTLIQQAPGIARDRAGAPLASPELVVAATLPLENARAANDIGSVLIRGVGDAAWQVRPQVRLIKGRRFKTGLRELVAGEGATRQFGLKPGEAIELGNQAWEIVGIFASGDAMASELWGDAETVAATYRRGSSRTSVIVRLTQPSALAGFKAALARDPRLAVSATTTLDYYSQKSASVTKIIRIVGLVVGAIMAIGALFGALNCMYTSVAARAREIATLRAIGFRGVSVVTAVLLETMLLALAGGVLGGIVAWLLFNGYTASTLAGGFGQLSFQFHVSGPLLWNGLKWALAIGFVGGVFPAVRAARLPVIAALRES